MADPATPPIPGIPLARLLGLGAFPAHSPRVAHLVTTVAPLPDASRSSSGSSGPAESS